MITTKSEILAKIAIASVFMAFVGLLFFLLQLPEKDVTDTVIQFDEGIDIGDRVITFDFDTPRNFVIEGTPRMVTPQAIINFSGDKVTYSGDLPVDEAAKVFFDVVLGYIQKEECR